mmetsp:Transcript_72469/g.235401  ORF Transcript_72469/g.235401 Transcript_72469/m.235401 type:complete len:236 (-) Transcript_72469:175-882(-)
MGADLSSLECGGCRREGKRMQSLPTFPGSVVANPHSFELSYGSLDEYGVRTIADMLQRADIKEVVLCHNNIGDAGCAILARALRYTSVEAIDLRGNMIGPKGIKALVDGLEKSCLKSLNLGNNHIGDEGAKLLAGALPTSGLEALHLSSNRIGIVGGEAIAKVLADCPSLKELTFDHNDIGDIGAFTFADHLSKSYLSKIDLRGNRISPRGSCALEHLFREMKGELRVVGLVYAN